MNKSQQQINLNFQVVPTAQGPKIIQQGVTVQPGTLDNLFAQLKYQNIPRPVSARVGNCSFISSQSWDGAAHLRYSAIKVGANIGDKPGLGRHYNPTRQRRRNSAHRKGDVSRDGDRNSPRSCSHPSLDEHYVPDPQQHARHQSNKDPPQLNIQNVDGQLGNPFMRIDAQSKSDSKKCESDTSMGEATRGRERNAAFNASVSSESNAQPYSQAPQYTMTQKLHNGAGMSVQTGSPYACSDLNLTNQRKTNRPEIGVIKSIIDSGCSTIDKVHEDHRVPDDQDHPDLSASFSKDAGQFCKQIYDNKRVNQQANSNSQDLVKFKQKLNESRNPSWTEEEVSKTPKKGYPDTVSFAPVGASSIVTNPHGVPQNFTNSSAQYGGYVSPPVGGTTPYFEASHKSNTMGTGKSDINRFSTGTVTDNKNIMMAAKTVRQSVSGKDQNLNANVISLHDQFAAQLPKTAQTSRGTAEQFYNLDGQVGLFTDRAGQTISTREAVGSQVLQESNKVKIDSGSPLAVQQDSLSNNRQDSIASQLVWQPSMAGADFESTEGLKVVSEEDISHQASMKSILADKRPADHSKSSQNGRNSTQSSTKKSLMPAKKKKKATKTMAGAMMLPGLPTGRSMTGRISPSIMKVESVKSNSLTSTMKSSAIKTPSGQKMVLKSNIAMSADLPKSIAKSQLKKGSAERTLKKKPIQTIPKISATQPVTVEISLAKIIKPSEMEDKKMSDNVMTPPDLDLVTQNKVVAAPPIAAISLVSVMPVAPPIAEISLVSVMPAMVQNKIAVPGKTNETVVKPDVLEAFGISEAQSEQTPQKVQDYDDSPMIDLGLLSDNLYKTNASQSFIQLNQIDATDQSPINLINQNSTTKALRRSKGDRAAGTKPKGAKPQAVKSRNNESCKLSQASSRSPTKSTRDRELQVLEIPKEYDRDSDHVVEYMLGDKAIEIEAPLYQVNISSKLVYQLTQLSGDEPPPFIKLVENKLGRKVIRIRQKETTGVQQLYQLKLEVRNFENNVSGVYKCRVFIRPGVKLLFKKSLFTSPVEYSIKGPASILQMPVYSAKHDDLDFYLERQGDVGDLPNFIRVSRDTDGNRVIKLHGNHINEIGIYELKLITRDKITRVINDEFTFTVVGTPGIEVRHLPKEYEEEIKVDPTQACIQLAMPTFNLETVKEEEAMPLEYSLMMRDETRVPDFIFIKTLENGEHIIELKAADLPPGLNTVFEVQLKVYDPNVDATQLIPISVKCPEPNLMLTLKQTNFPEKISYSIGSKEIFVKVPIYDRNDGQPLQEQVLLTLGGKESTIVSRIAQIYTSESGEQFIKVQTFDQRMKGTYEVKVYATEQNSGLTNQDAQFKLIIVESVLTLTDTPNVCYLGKSLLYQPKGPPTYVPLPQYVIQRAQIQFSLSSGDPQVALPPFVCIQGDYLVVEGNQNPTMCNYHLKLVAFDPVSESKDELEVQITSNIYEIVLERVPFTSPVEFMLGDELTLPMPIYKEVPFSGDLAYELEIQGAGMMLAGIELASIVYTEEGQPMIKIAGGKNNNKGTYHITVKVSEKALGVSNKAAVFMLEAKPQLKLFNRPAEFDQMPPMQVDLVYKLPVPIYATKKRLRYQIQEKGTDDEQACPSFITVKCPKQAQPYIEVKCTKSDYQSMKAHYDLEIITCENIKHNVENVQEFSLQFNLQPRLELKSFDTESPVRYSLGQGSMIVPLPIFDCYIVELRNLEIKLMSDYAEREVPFAIVDRENDCIVINSDNQGFEGLHDISIMVADSQYFLTATSPSTSTSRQSRLKIQPVINDQAKFRVEIAVGKSPSNVTIGARSQETLAICQDARSEGQDLHIVKSGGYHRKPDQPNPATTGARTIADNETQNVELICDKISKIEENEDIPIYYSADNSINDDTKLPITPQNERQDTFVGKQQQKKDGDGDENDVVVTADAAILIVGGSNSKHYISSRGDHNGSLINDEDQNALPKEQIDMLMRENEEIKRQIAEVKTQMDQSMARNTNNAGAHNMSQQHLSPIRGAHQCQQSQVPSNSNNQLPHHQQLNSPEALAQLHASMQLLTNLNQSQQQVHQSGNHFNLAGLLANNLDEAQLQEEAILNNQLRQRIEQSKLRQMQQMTELDRMRNEHNQGQTSQQQQLLNHYLTETNGQGREKDIRLRQLRTQLAQLQEQRAGLRKQCTTLKQKEDDLQSDLFTKDQQLKGLSKRNQDQSTKATSVFSEIDKVIYRNDNIRAEVTALEEQLEDKKQIVSRNKDKLKDLNGTQTELEDKITSQKHRVNKLRVEMESVKRRLDHEESMANMGPPRQQNHSENLNLQTAALSAQNDSREQQRLLQQLQRKELLKLQALDYDMPEQIHGMVPQHMPPNSARASSNQFNGNYQSAINPFAMQQQTSFGGSPQQSTPQHQHATGFNPITGLPISYQSYDGTDQPAAGMPSERKSLNGSGGAMPVSQSQQQFMRHQGYIPASNQGHYQSYSGQNSSEKKITNPKPQRACRPKENNIFGEQAQYIPQQDLNDSSRFQTTYTQFANREKFRGSREGEHGGLRISHQQTNSYNELDQMRRSQMYANNAMQAQGGNANMSSGMSTERRRINELQTSSIAPHQNRNFNNYEKRYRY